VGGPGADTISGGGGDDRIYVRGTDDVYDYIDAGETTEKYGDTLVLSVGANQLDSTVTLNRFDADASGIEHLEGYYSVIQGTTDNNLFDLSGLVSISGLLYVDGVGGNDVIIGSNFSDDLRGGDGNDRLDGGGGVDIMAGGTGNDRYAVDNVDDKVIENAIEGTDLVNASVSYTLSDNVENLNLTGVADIDGIGNALDNRINGNSGNNVLSGGDGGDTLKGGDGNDVLIGGAGQDRLIGAAGSDTFKFLSLSDTGVGGGTRDHIVDFTAGSDHIALSAIDANASTPADDPFTFIGTAAFDHLAGEAGELWQFAAGGNTIVAADVDGDGHADFVIALNGSYTLLASDFIL
jgi:Ca2+-binding RTX toxin-like protein